jgi:formate hydrogenlyase subunit 6/NADH:ubiquinone oxidoreductase subunit I
MMKILLARFQQGHRTVEYPEAPPVLPDRFRGAPVIDAAKCPEGCEKCREACPTDAIRSQGDRLAVDLGRCLFCTECVSACPAGAIAYSTDHRLAARRREDLVVTTSVEARVQSLDEKMRRLFGRSLKLRQVSAGGCNACEADVNVLSTIVFDLGRLESSSSPRHVTPTVFLSPGL